MIPRTRSTALFLTLLCVALAVPVLLGGGSGATVPPAFGEDEKGKTSDRDDADDPPPSEDPPPDRLPPEDAVKTIKGGDAKKHAFFLAGKKCNGRASGMPGCDLAGEYIIDLLTEWGLEPKGEDGFKQFFEVRMLPFPGQPPPKDKPPMAVGKTFNVCAVMPGSDPELKNEYVVLSAHYDHTGARSRKKIYFGADDNASGTATLLEVAQAFATEGVPRPRRSVMILFVSGEERGLLGSKHYVAQPTVPISQIVCNLNIDMVGRNDSKEMFVYGNASSPDLDVAHRGAMKLSGLKFIAKTGSIFRRSDQYNFYLKDIPCLFWTSGLHKDYHSTKDVPKKLKYAKIERAAKHAFHTAWTVAERRERPNFVKMDAAGSAGRLGAVLIMMPAEDVPQAKLKDGQGAVLVSTVMADMPAAKAKIKEGDLIVGIGKKPLPDMDPVSAIEDAALAAKHKISLVVMRGRSKKRITVKF